MLDRFRAFELRYTDPLLSAPSQQLQTLPSSLAPFACGCIIKIKRARTPINTRSVLVYTACVVMSPSIFMLVGVCSRCWVPHREVTDGMLFFFDGGGAKQPIRALQRAGLGYTKDGFSLFLLTDLNTLDESINNSFDVTLAVVVQCRMVRPVVRIAERGIEKQGNGGKKVVSG